MADQTEPVSARTWARLTPGTASGVSAATAATFLASSAAPTPIYRLYQDSMGLGPGTLTLIFAAYAASLLVALLTVGSLSDHVGRRPVILAALALNALAMAVFIWADNALALAIARLIQGFATGMATTALGAAILDTDRIRGPLLNSLTAFIGLFAGSLGSGLLVTFAPLPTVLIYVVLFVISIVEAAILFLMPETSPRSPGAWHSLIPEIRLPRAARSAFLHSAPANIAAWALGGFNFSLIPSVVRLTTGVESPLLGACVVATLTLTAIVAVGSLRQTSPQRELILGASSLAVGIAVTLVAIALHHVVALFIGVAITGVGFGGAFSGTLRSLLPLAPDDERAGLLATFYVESYVAFSLPVVLIGVALPAIGLTLATYIYGIGVALLALASIAALVGSDRRPSV